MRRLTDAAWRVGLRIAYQVLKVCWFVFRPRRPSAHIAVWWEGKILIIRNSYKRRLSIPAGSFRRGEAPEVAAARELAEEVGIRVEPSELRFVTEIHCREDYKDDRGYFFELTCRERPDVEIDHREVVWADFWSVEDALEADLTNPARTFLEALGGGADSKT